jgi:hypothetical protein
MFKDVKSNHQLNRYLKFINSCKTQVINGYFEKHHIVPKCLGGSNDSNNLVKMTARQHFIAHLILSKIFKGNYEIKMNHAVWNMVNRDSGVRTNSRTYEILRTKISKILSAKFTGANNPMFGKSFTGKHRNAISKKLKGKLKPKGFAEKMSLRVSGSGNPMYNKPKTKNQIEASRKALLNNNPMKLKEVVDKIKKAKEGTINCYDLALKKYVRITKEMFNNSSHYVGNNSKLIERG